MTVQDLKTHVKNVYEDTKSISPNMTSPHRRDDSQNIQQMEGRYVEGGVLDP